MLLCLCTAALLAVSCKKPDTPDPVKPDPVKDKTVTLKVMSFNIRHTGEASDTGVKAWNNRKAAVVNMIKQEQPDMIGFQECTTEQLKYLNTELPEYTPFQPGYNKFCMFRTTQFKQESQGLFFHSDTPDVTGSKWDQSDGVRVTAWLKLKEQETGRTLWFFDTHLDATYEKARKKSIELIVSEMRSICGESAPQIVVGDMNTSSDECHDIYKSWLTSSREAPLSDLCPTYQGFGTYSIDNAKPIDYIYTKNIKMKEHRTLNGANYGVQYISDHWPIMLTFELSSK